MARDENPLLAIELCNCVCVSLIMIEESSATSKYGMGNLSGFISPLDFSDPILIVMVCPGVVAILVPLVVTEVFPPSFWVGGGCGSAFNVKANPDCKPLRT